MNNMEFREATISPQERLNDLRERLANVEAFSEVDPAPGDADLIERLKGQIAALEREIRDSGRDSLAA